MVFRTVLTSILCIGCTAAFAQDNKFVVTGAVQSDMLLQETVRIDPVTGNKDYRLDEFRTNTFVDVNVGNNNWDFGGRIEYLEHPLPGFEADYKGWGPAHYYAKFHKDDKLEITLGTFYEQFGSGFVLRSYEERSLGIDNALLGGRLVLRPWSGVQAKILLGKQRRYWDYNDAMISGYDLEFGLENWIKRLQESGTVLTLGGSWVHKSEEVKDDVFADISHKLVFPDYVDAYDLRLNYQRSGFNLLAEYAGKSHDPSFDNNYIYHNGYVTMLSASYSKKGMSMLLQAKRSEDFSFRSRSVMVGTSSFINHLPAFTEDHTYALATIYPYATQYPGEWAYQAQFGYNFKRKTALGGKYGTNVKVNFSHVHSLNKDLKGLSGTEGLPDLAPGGRGTEGYSSAFFKWGNETYYQDLNIQIEKRFTKDFKLHLMYMNQFYNQWVVEREGGMVHSDIFVADGLYKFSTKFTLRAEAQYLATKDDKGDWVFGLVELNFAPHWMFTMSDTYNCGKAHYWQLLGTYNYKAHRIQLGWGRTREGYNCSGGVCRYVPETKGFTLSYNYNF